MARFWACVQTKQPLEPTSTFETKLLYRESAPTNIIAPASVEQAVSALKTVKDQIKALEEREEQLTAAVQGFMGVNSELVTFDNKVLATWKSSKSSKKFDAKLFQANQPSLYEQYVVEVPGSRRFLVK